MNKSETVAIIRSLLSSTNCNYNIWSLNVDFKKETGFDIPIFGYSNLSDFLQSIPDTVKVSGMYPVQRVSLVRNEKSAHIVSLVNRTKTPDHKKQNSRRHSGKAAINNRIRNSVIQKRPINIEVTGVETFKDDDRSQVIMPNSTKCLTNPLESPEHEISLKKFLDVGEKIPPIDIKLLAKVGEYVEVVPEYICSPHKFYFHFRKFKKKFSAFMDKIQIFYERHENIPEMTEGEIKPTQLCAVFHKINNIPMWHRVEVNEIFSKSHVIVNFIDYGCTAKVLKLNLKYLHRDFMSLPKQAVLGSLANITPKGKSEWSRDAVKRFSTLALQEDLLAGVVEADIEGCSVKVALSCTKGLELHINDTLVQEGYAEFETDVLNNHSVGVVKRPLSMSRKMNISKIECTRGKTDYAEELRSMGAEYSPTLTTPFLYFSSTFSDNKRLQKMFSVA